jgi:hypothetical protein
MEGPLIKFLKFVNLQICGFLNLLAASPSLENNRGETSGMDSKVPGLNKSTLLGYVIFIFHK